MKLSNVAKIGLLLLSSLSISVFADTVTYTTTIIPAEPTVTTTRPQSPVTPQPQAGAAQDFYINTNVLARIAEVPSLMGTNISTTTLGGIVTLDGTVNTQAQADAAINAAKSTPGVKNVQSNISVKGYPISTFP